MSQGGYRNFGEIFSEVISEMRNDPIQHLLVLTYEFDEEQLLNLASGRSLEDDLELERSQLKFLSDIRPLVIYDARKTRPFGKLPQFLELHPYKSPAYSCHHSKAYLVITRKTVRLTLGSFNLTATGLFKNREVMEPYLWSKDSTADVHILGQWVDFLERYYAPRIKASSRSALLPIIESLKGWMSRLPRHVPGTEMSRLIHSGYGEKSGLDALVESWERWFPGTAPDSMLVVSPFFDHTPADGGIALAIRKHFPGMQKFSLITEERLLSELSQANYVSIGTDQHRGLFLIEGELSQAEKERLYAVWGKKAIDDQRITRNLHAKMLLLRSGKRALAYMGSANFTGKAWLGDNCELGVAWVVDKPDLLEKRIFAHLYVGPNNRYADLSATPVAAGTVEDDEGYREESLFPEFLEQVLLAPDKDGSRVRFRFECINGRELERYRILWGGTDLEVRNAESQWIAREDFQALLLGRRNLAFIPREKPENCYWMPFQYDGTLIAERETLLHPSTRDWLAYYLDPDRVPSNDGSVLPGEEDPEDESDEPDQNDPLDEDDTSRGSNCVIAMQRYLNDYARIELQFHERLADITGGANSGQQRALLTTRILEPLQGLCRLLDREHPASSAERLFKLGELRLFVGLLSQAAPAPLRPHFRPLLKQIDKALPHSDYRDGLQGSYWSFVKSREVAAHA